MAQQLFEIAEFPRDGRRWRVALFGGVARNALVPSEPVIEVLLASVPENSRDPFSQESMRAFDTRQIPIGVGQLPYVSQGSIWRDGRPIAHRSTVLKSFKRTVDVSVARFVSIDELRAVIPLWIFGFRGNWNHARDTLVVAIEADGDPFAVLIPVAEIIRFYYAPSTRLAQALFWGVYDETINPEKCGQIVDGPYRVHLRKFIDDSDAWTLARFHASRVMQAQVQQLYAGFQKHNADAMSAYAPPFRSYRCGFPFEGMTTIDALQMELPGPSPDKKRSLILKLQRCSAPFPFDQLVCYRDNKNFRGSNANDDNLLTAWLKKMGEEDGKERENHPPDNTLHSDSEPLKGLSPLVIDIREDRFADLVGKDLIKEPTELQKYRNAKVSDEQKGQLEGFGTGEGIWGRAHRKPAKMVTTKERNTNLPASLGTFFLAMKELANDASFEVRFVMKLSSPLELGEQPVTVPFPTSEQNVFGTRRLSWALPRSPGKPPRQVAIAEVTRQSRTCYVLESERFLESDKLAILILANADFSPLSEDQMLSLLLRSAGKRRWLSPDAMSEFRRATTTHKAITSTTVLADRIKRKSLDVLGISAPESAPEGPAQSSQQATEQETGLESASLEVQ